MSPIDPGTPCWLRNLLEPLQAWNGRPVTVRDLWDHCDCCGEAMYRVDAVWLRETTSASGLVVPRAKLLPMAGPDREPESGQQQLGLLECLPEHQAATADAALLGAAS